MNISSLRHKYKKLQNSKKNIELLMLELFDNSGSDYTTERMHGHMYRCGMNVDEGRLYKMMLDLELQGVLVFVGHIPIYTDDNHAFIGTDPVFGLIKQGWKL